MLKIANRAAANDELARPFLDRYRQWAASDEKTRESLRDTNMREGEMLERKPVISIVMPVCDPSPEHLQAALQSVVQQHWQHWQLCICDDASSNPEIRSSIEKFRSADQRICVTVLEKRGGISAASNAALALADGEWAAFLDHDDTMAPDALFEIAKAIVRNPGAKTIYTDEDKLDSNGERCLPTYKPDWDSELLRGYNFLNHVTCYRLEAVRAAGGFRKEFDGAQDHDLALRITEQLDASEVVHLPRILYHWRMVRGSTAASSSFKPAAFDAGRRAVEEHLKRLGIAARVESNEPTIRVRYSAPTPRPLVSIVIPTRDHIELLAPCVESVLAKSDYREFEIVVVDNDTADSKTLGWLQSAEMRGDIRVVRAPGSFNFSRLVNVGAASAKGCLLLLLNNDTVVIAEEWLSELVAVCMRDRVGAVGAKLLFPDGSLQHAGVVLNPVTGSGHWFKGYPGNHGGPAQRLNVTQRLSAVTGACLMTPAAAYKEVGGFDETDFTVAFNDIDYCLKLADAGYAVYYTPFAKLIHVAGASRGSDKTIANYSRFDQEMAAMKRKWGAVLDNDPWAMPGIPAELSYKGWIE